MTFLRNINRFCSWIDPLWWYFCRWHRSSSLIWMSRVRLLVIHLWKLSKWWSEWSPIVIDGQLYWKSSCDGYLVELTGLGVIWINIHPILWIFYGVLMYTNLFLNFFFIHIILERISNIWNWIKKMSCSSTFWTLSVKSFSSKIWFYTDNAMFVLKRCSIHTKVIFLILSALVESSHGVQLESFRFSALEYRWLGRE